jgi:hypothetical protein
VKDALWQLKHRVKHENADISRLDMELRLEAADIFLTSHAAALADLIEAAQSVSAATRAWNTTICRMLGRPPQTGIDLARMDEALAKLLPKPKLLGNNPDFLVVDEIGLPTQ